MMDPSLMVTYIKNNGSSSDLQIETKYVKLDRYKTSIYKPIDRYMKLDPGITIFDL